MSAPHKHGVRDLVAASDNAGFTFVFIYGDCFVVVVKQTSAFHTSAGLNQTLVLFSAEFAFAAGCCCLGKVVARVFTPSWFVVRKKIRRLQ